MDNYLEKYFINPGIEYGIKSYISYKNHQPYSRIYTYEMNVIKALTIIYGEKSILLPYRIDNEKAFECNLLMYDLKESDMLNFIKYMNEYYEFMADYKSEKKATGLINEIEKILLEMIIKRSKRKEYTEDEIKEFDMIFNPTNGDLKKIKELVSSNDGLIIRTWESNKFELTNTQIKMIAVNPNLLSTELYQKYGFDIRTVASLTNEEIININKSIDIDEKYKVEMLNKTEKRKSKFVLTSGSGFVDKLIIVSIVMTGLMLTMVLIINVWGIRW